jgi:hypothetical protein
MVILKSSRGLLKRTLIWSSLQAMCKITFTARPLLQQEQVAWLQLKQKGNYQLEDFPSDAKAFLRGFLHYLLVVYLPDGCYRTGSLA